MRSETRALTDRVHRPTVGTHVHWRAMRPPRWLRLHPRAAAGAAQGGLGPVPRPVRVAPPQHPAPLGEFEAATRGEPGALPAPAREAALRAAAKAGCETTLPAAPKP